MNHEDHNSSHPVIEITTPEIEMDAPRPSCRKFTIDFVPEPLPRTQLPLERGYSIEDSLSTTSYTSNTMDDLNERSPSLVVPNIRDIFKMKNRISSVEDGCESSAESDDGYLTLNAGSSITEMISPPIQKNARKEGVISDTIDKTNITIEMFEKDAG